MGRKLTVKQDLVLSVLRENPGVTVNELASKMPTKPGGLRWLPADLYQVLQSLRRHGRAYREELYDSHGRRLRVHVYFPVPTIGDPLEVAWALPAKEVQHE